ncbi:Essential protein Yae1, N terminal [Arachnomyces sp. PD_36]|nr:Essential protein Yae1, N terminal [Arachnomyces sp. PD_36]
MTSTHTDDGVPGVAQTINDTLDDIFGSSPPAAASHLGDENGAYPTHSMVAAEPSDLPSVRRQHVTSGYRDGITVSKGANVQRGFDTAFPVGGNLGLRAGILLGILEGIVSARGRGGKTESGDGDLEALRMKAEELYRAAKKEMAVSGVFGGLDQSENEDKDPVEQLGGEGERVLESWETRVRQLVAGEHS